MENGHCFSDSCVNTISNSPPTTSLTFRPKGSLARALLEKQKHDEFLDAFDKRTWYQCNFSLLSTSLATKFVQLHPDEDTLQFLKQSEKKSDWVFTQVWHSLIKLVFGLFMTQTSINGWLRRGSMFVISHQQFKQLLLPSAFDHTWKSETLLDLGAGDGEVTAQLAPSFKKVYVTEVSKTMRSLLEMKGYEVLEIDNWHVDRKYDFISCLNLIDRCDTPLELLQQIRHSLNPNGVVLLAVVLPFSAYVEYGSPDHKPKELLPIKGPDFEQQVESVVRDVLNPNGFEVISWSRVPYLCEGDLQQSYYWLDDAIFLLRLKSI
ncbi:unnamed protein product [Phyllotreta striolata]|uniref:Methyltransferase-like protein 9 n=1 Tax=Phyllotreta striolata TaxID=444603 RepID=A0A9N9TIW8_PHYSR|nr:unnamed protein product [Phyllotreta striolata]